MITTTIVLSAIPSQLHQTLPFLGWLARLGCHEFVAVAVYAKTTGSPYIVRTI